MRNRELKKRIIDISYKHKLSHIGSCITAVDIIWDIYNKKKSWDKFILSAGHSGLALYVVLEKLYGVSAEELLSKNGIHPTFRDEYIDCATGSLGHGVGIGVGMALAEPNVDIWVLTTDGEVAEGSIYEAYRVANELKLTNLKTAININGFSALSKTDPLKIVERLAPFVGDIPLEVWGTECNLPYISGLDAHYKSIDETEYQEIIKFIEEQEDE